MPDEGERAARQRKRSRRADGNHADRSYNPDELTANQWVEVNGGERDEGASECRCEATFHGDQLIIDAEPCPGRGRLASNPSCRETVIDALSVRDAAAVCTRVDDTERACASEAAGLLLAAGRFVTLCRPHDPALAARTRRDPLAGARLAAGRSDFPTRIAAETGLLEGAVRFESYHDAFGDRDTYRVRESRCDAGGRTGYGSGERTDHGLGRIERTARAFDDGEPGAGTDDTTTTHPRSLGSRTSDHSISTDLWCRDEPDIMFHEESEAGELPADELRARYDDQLRGTIDEHGIDHVVETSGVDRERVSALAAGESPTLTLEEGATVLALADDEPDAEAIVAETRDHLLMGMTIGVLDVEAVESGIDGSFDAREIQQKIEGRLRMTLDELAQLHSYIDSRSP